MNDINRKLLLKSIMEGVSMSALVVGVAVIFGLVIVSMITWLIGHPWIIYGIVALVAFTVLSAKWSREFYKSSLTQKGKSNEKSPFTPIS